MLCAHQISIYLTLVASTADITVEMAWAGVVVKNDGLLI
jgi:hypothetical protein